MKQDVTVKTFISNFEQLAYNQGLDASRVFDDMLQYIIFGFTPDHPPLTNWNYTKEQTAQIYELMTMWFKVMQKETTSKEWYDAFGVIYEDTIVGKSRRSNSGQFFTPMHACDLMAKVTYEGQSVKVGALVGDPTCGSGRTLLSFNAYQKGCYLVGEDLDRTCALMTVCNFIIHGCVGEVVWHDSLRPETYYGGWKVNAGLNNPLSPYFGTPHCELLNKEDSVVWNCWNSKEDKISRIKVGISSRYPTKELALAAENKIKEMLSSKRK